jgi:acyl-[acyl carrier protein]--UDP-N-acetylglucosamine O-acyltransferase
MVTVKRGSSKIWKFEGVAKVDGRSRAEAEFMAMIDLNDAGTERWRSIQRAQVHPSAMVEDGAEIGAGCRIGPFAVIGPEVRAGRRGRGQEPRGYHRLDRIWARAGGLSLRRVGEVPQDLKFAGERTRLIVGRRCRIREGATLNTGTEGRRRRHAGGR